MSDDEENFLGYNFHDSYLKDIEIRENKATLVIDTDIYWSPGKPFSLLTLVNPGKLTRFKELVGGRKISSESIQKAVIKRSEDNNFCLDIEFHSGREISVEFYNFWVDRVEEYKDYSNTTFR